MMDLLSSAMTHPPQHPGRPRRRHPRAGQAGPAAETGVRDRRHAGAAAARARLCRPCRTSSAASRCRPPAPRRSGAASAPRSIRFTMTRCAAPAPTGSGRLGLSAAKIKTLKNLAREIAAERLNLDVLANEDADAAHNTLTALHGIGPWTADVYLLFCLGHGDAWPAGDLAVQEAVKIGLGLKTRPTAKADGAAGGAVASAARRRGASVVGLLPGAEEARGRDRGQGERRGKNSRTTAAAGSRNRPFCAVPKGIGFRARENAAKTAGCEKRAMLDRTDDISIAVENWLAQFEQRARQARRRPARNPVSSRQLLARRAGAELEHPDRQRRATRSCES